MPRCYYATTAIFYPILHGVAAITQGPICIVTTTENHGYVDGIIVRMDIPLACGMQQINGQTSSITIVDNLNFILTDIDSTLYEPFVAPNPVTTPRTINICAQVVPIGELSNTLYAATQNILPNTTI